MKNGLGKWGDSEVAGGPKPRCVRRAVPAERYTAMAVSILQEFQEAGFDVAKMDSNKVLTLGKGTVVDSLGEVNGLHHVYGLGRALSDGEMDALVGFVEGLQVQEVFLSGEVQEVDPNEVVRAIVGGDGDSCVGVAMRIGDVLGRTV